MTDPTPQTTPTRDEAVRELIEKLDEKHGAWRYWDGTHTVFTSLPEQAASMLRQLTSAPAPAIGGMDAVAGSVDDAIATIWMAAMTVACNAVIMRQNDLNDDDGPVDVLNEQGAIIAALKKWLQPDSVYLEGVRDLLHPADLASLSPAAAPVSEAGGEHPDDLAVDRFAAAMKAKLAEKRAEGRGGWEDKQDCSNAFLSDLLREHIDKGDPIDVGNLAMMIHQRDERVAKPASSPASGPFKHRLGPSRMRTKTRRQSMAEKMDGYHGHMTLSDGSHVALTADEAKALWEASEAAQAKSEADFPDEQTALREISRAMQRLRDFKWSDGIYCPKDGSEFEIIEAGSTGIFRCRYDGEWPDGMWLTFADGDVYPSSRPPLMFRRLPEAQAEYDRKMREAAERYAADRALDEASHDR